MGTHQSGARASVGPSKFTQRLNGLDGGLDGGLEQQFQAVFADGGAKAADLRGVARQPRLVVLLAAEELPHHVLPPTEN